MRNFWLITCLFALLWAVPASAQVSQNYWILSASYLKPALSTWGLQLPYLTSQNCLGTDNTGKVQAGTCGGGGTPGGSNTQVQFNDSGSFGGSALFTFDKTTHTITLTGTGGDPFDITTGTDNTGNPSRLQFLGGDATAASNSNGAGIAFVGGTGDGTGFGGSGEFTGGDGGATGDGGGFSFSGGVGGATSGTGGSITITSGAAIGGNSNGGDVLIATGDKAGSGTVGVIKLRSGTSGKLGILDVSGLASTDKTFTFPNISGTLCLTTTCLTSAPDPFYHPATNQSATTSTMLFFGNASTTQFTATSSIWFTGLTGGIIESDTNGKLYREATSSTSVAGATVVRDANQNAFANNFISKGTNTNSSGGTTNLTAASTRYQFISGTGQTFNLPDATTLSIGSSFTFNNNSSGNLVINNNGGSLQYTLTPGGIATVYLIVNSTSNGSWDTHPGIPTNSTWGTALLTVPNASTTNTTVGTSLQIPAATAPSLVTTGYVAVASSTASSSVQFVGDNGVQRGLYDVTAPSFTYSTSTPTGTSTIPVEIGPRGTALISIACKSVGGTANVQIGNYSASTTMVTSSTGTPAPTTLSSNNTFNAWSTMYIDIGTFSASTVTSVSCGLGRRYTY